MRAAGVHRMIRAAELYGKGIPTKAIAKETGLSQEAVLSAAIWKGLEPRREIQHREATERARKALAMFYDGFTQTQIAKALGIARPTVRGYIKRVGLCGSCGQRIPMEGK